jgi:hypothetical protein
MTYANYLIYIPILAAVIGYTVFMRRKAANAMANMRPAAIEFFRRTGYCYHDRPNMPPEVQADRAATEANELMAMGQKQASGENYEYSTHYVRNHHGLVIHFITRFGYEKSGTTSTSYRSAAWTAELPSPPRVPIHIADKSLVGLAKAAGELFSNTKRHFTPRGSRNVTTGVPAIDSKLAVWGEDEAAVRQVLASNPAIADMLSNWASLDVYVTSEGAAFNDPSQENMTAAMGGMIGNMALGFDMGKRMELSIPVHDRVCDLLLALVRATS